MTSWCVQFNLSKWGDCVKFFTLVGTVPYLCNEKKGGEKGNMACALGVKIDMHTLV